MGPHSHSSFPPSLSSHLTEAHVVWEVLIQVHSPEGGAPKGVPEPQENARVPEPPLALITLFLFLWFLLIS
jgi:hypothetical protein